MAAQQGVACSNLEDLTADNPVEKLVDLTKEGDPVPMELVDIEEEGAVKEEPEDKAEEESKVKAEGDAIKTEAPADPVAKKEEKASESSVADTQTVIKRETSEAMPNIKEENKERNEDPSQGDCSIDGEDAATKDVVMVSDGGDKALMEGKDDDGNAQSEAEAKPVKMEIDTPAVKTEDAAAAPVNMVASGEANSPVTKDLSSGKQLSVLARKHLVNRWWLATDDQPAPTVFTGSSQFEACSLQATNEVSAVRSGSVGFGVRWAACSVGAVRY